jgi:hypothetical protein
MITDAHSHLEERILPVGKSLAEMDRHRIGRPALVPAAVEPI